MGICILPIMKMPCFTYVYAFRSVATDWLRKTQSIDDISNAWWNIKYRRIMTALLVASKMSIQLLCWPQCALIYKCGVLIRVWFFLLFSVWNKATTTTNIPWGCFLHYYTPTQRSWWGGGGYWFHSVRLSVRPSVCPSVQYPISALWPLHFWLGPFHIHTSYQATSEGVLRIKCLAKFQNLNFWKLQFTLTLSSFDLGSDVITGLGSHGAAGVSQNTGVLVVLVPFHYLVSHPSNGHISHEDLVHGTLMITLLRTQAICLW